LIFHCQVSYEEETLVTLKTKSEHWE